MSVRVSAGKDNEERTGLATGQSVYDGTTMVSIHVVDDACHGIACNEKFKL